MRPKKKWTASSLPLMPESNPNASTHKFKAVKLVALLPALTLLAFVTMAMRAETPPSPTNPEFIPALWVVTLDHITKLAAADGKKLLEITDARAPEAVGIDEEQGVIWVIRQALLEAYGFNGEFRLSVPIPSLNDGEGEDEESDEHEGEEEDGQVALAVNPVNGSVWLAIDKDLHHFDSQGELLESLELPHHVQGAVLDPLTERLWVATQKSVVAFEDDSTSPNIVVDLGTQPQVRDIDLDPDFKYLWVALENNEEDLDERGDHVEAWSELRRYDLTTGALQTRRTITNLQQVASDRQGGLWLATDRELKRLDAEDQVAVTLNPVEGSEGQIIALAANPHDLTAWVSTEKIVKHIAGQGQVLLTTALTKPSILDLLPYRDPMPSELESTSSSGRATVNAAAPAGVEPLGVCRVAEGGETTLVYTFNNTSSANVELELSDRNTFDAPADRGQPRWFPPGKGAFKAVLQGDADIWKLGQGEMRGDATTARCVLERDGALTKLVLNGDRITIGIDAGGVASTAIKDTTQWPAIDRSAREFAAGGTAGSFSVSHDGAALYTIPIRLPRGRGGFVPRELALAYNSNAGNGIVGVGFQLAGTSQIQRCTRHPIFGDENIQPIAWDDTAFCLDGKRLIADGRSQYRFEDDPAYRIKITRGSEGAPEVFEVEDGAGNTLVYGESEESRVEDYILEHVIFDPFKPGQPEVNRSADRTRTRFAWSLSSVRNRFGQMATFTYARDFVADERNREWGVAQRLTHIAYDVFTVEFNHEARPDAWERYIRGMRLFNNGRLGEIRILLGTAKEGTLIRRYVLDYEEAPLTHRSRLTSVKECDGRGACKAPLEFAWQDPDQTFRPTGRHIRLEDLDFWNKVTTLAVQVLDLNNDGRDDLFLRTRTQVDPPSGYFWEYALSDGQGFSNGDLVPIDPKILPAGDQEVSVSNRPVFLGRFDLGFNLGSQKWTRFSELIVADLNADGNPELGVRTDDGAGPYQFYSWKGGSAFETFGMTIPRLMPYVGDIDGNALPDLVTKHDNPREWRFLLNSRDRPGLEFPTQLNFIGSREQTRGDFHPDLSGALIMDTNGDARYEFLIKRHNASENRLAGTYAVINPFLFGPSISESYLPIQIDWRYVVFDANGDGLSDLVTSPPFECGANNLDFGTGVRPLFYQSTGAGFRSFWNNSYPDAPDPTSGRPSPWKFGESVTPSPPSRSSQCPNFPAVDAIDNGVRAADLDGDGRQELLVLGERWFCQPQDGHCIVPNMALRQPFVVRLGYDGRWEIDTVSLAGLAFSPPLQSFDPKRNFQHNHGYKLTRILDIDGDGIPEILHPRVLGAPSVGTPVVLEVYKRMSEKGQSKKADLLASVTDSLGATTEVTYAPMSDRSVFEPATQTCSYPLHCPRRGRWLVREVTRSTGVASAATRRELHRYSGARADLSGRDWLGFAQHVVTDVARNSETVYEFDNVTRQGRFYPFAGLVQRQVTTYRSVPGRFLRVENSTNYQNHAKSSDRVLVRPTLTCGARYDAPLPDQPPPGRAPRILPFSEVCTRYTDYDDYGFARNTTRTGSMETLERVTTFEHRDNQSPRILGIVTGVRELSTVGGVSQERTVSIVPDDHGLPKTQTIEPDAADLMLVTEFVRDEVGLPLEVIVTGRDGSINPQPRKTSTQYDSLGYPQVVINSAGHRESFVYHHGLGVPITRLDANGVLTQFAYDGFGRLVSTIHPAGADTFVTYSAGPDTPLVVSTTQKEGETILASTTVHHDILGRPIHRQSVAPRTRTVHVWTRYDVLGRAVAVSAPQFDPDETQAQFGFVRYDPLDRVIERRDPDGIVAATAAYERFTSTVTNARGKKQVTHRDALGAVLLTQSQNEEGDVRGEVTFGYGPFGVLMSASKKLSGNPLTTTMTYDRLGRRTSISDPDRGTTQWLYNAFGEAVIEIAADGVIEIRIYDQLGRRVETVNEHGLTALTYDTSPGGIGSLSLAASPDGIETTLSYDPFGRPSSETVNVLSVERFTVERWYDNAGRLGGIRYPNVMEKRFEVSYDYSTSAGAVLWRVKDGTGQTLWQAENHSPFGVLSQEAFGNGFRTVRQLEATTGLLRGIETGFVSEPFSDETSAEPPTGIPDDVPLLQGFGFDYDPARNIKLSVEVGMDPGGILMQVWEEFGYDDLNRLASWKVTSVPQGHPSEPVNYDYHYDDHGNLELRVPDAGDADWRFEYGGPRPHAITKSIVGGVSRSYDYDSRGRRHQDGERTIAYTRFDLPKTITQGGSLIAEFRYDAFGRRVRKYSNRIETLTIGGLYERVSPGRSGGTTHRFHIEGPGRVVAEVEWVKRGADVSQDVRYLHVDRQGSVEIVTGSQPDQVLGRQRFEPYGNMVDPSDLAVPRVQPLVAGLRRGFTGHEHDEELGFVDMRGRVYDPRSAAFLSPDPVVTQPQMAHSFHPYAYVTYNPANFTDPTGFQGQASSGTLDVPESAGTEADTGEDCATEVDFPSEQMSLAEYDRVIVDGFTLPGSMIIESSVRPAGQTSDDNGSLRQAAAVKNAAVRKQSKATACKGKTSRTGEGHSPGCTAGMEGCDAEGNTGVDLRSPEFSHLNLGRFSTQLRDPITGSGGVLEYVEKRAVDPPGGMSTMGPGEMVGFVRSLPGLARSLIGLGRAARNSARSTFVYRLVDEAGDAVYFGVSKDYRLAQRLNEHSKEFGGNFRGMQVISGPLYQQEAKLLETQLIQLYQPILNTAPRSIRPPFEPIYVPPQISPRGTLLNPILYYK